MNTNSIELLKKIIRSNKKPFYIFTLILWIISTAFVIYLLRLPIETVKETYENNITQETIFKYKADVIPFALNPAGGITEFEKGTFTSVTKDIILHISSSIQSDKPIAVNGTKKVVLKLISEELWEKEYLLSPETSFQMQGTDNKVIDDDYSINLKGLANFIEAVEEDINTASSNYTFEITPVIHGTITYNGKEMPIDLDAQNVINYSQTQIKVSEEKKFTKATPIVNTLTISQHFSMLGNKVSLVKAKYSFASIYIIALIILIVITIRNAKTKKSAQSERQVIDTKYKVRLINIVQDVSILDHQNILLDSFMGLLTISDEKECPILRHESKDRVVYYVIFERYIFSYEIVNHAKGKMDLQVDPIMQGSAM